MAALGTELPDISRRVALNHKTVFPSCADTHLHSHTYMHALARIGVSMQRTQLLNPTASHSFAITL